LPIFGEGRRGSSELIEKEWNRDHQVVGDSRGDHLLKRKHDFSLKKKGGRGRDTQWGGDISRSLEKYSMGGYRGLFHVLEDRRQTTSQKEIRTMVFLYPHTGLLVGRV